MAMTSMYAGASQTKWFTNVFWCMVLQKEKEVYIPEILSIINNKKCLILLLKDFSGSHVNIFLVKILTPYCSHPSECVCVPDNVRKRPV